MTEQSPVQTSQFPVTQLWNKILFVPIVGEMNEKRTKTLMETLLETTRETGSKVVILDLSGVATMDTEVSKRLMDLGEAVRLMGARYMICGIQPNQTHTLVNLGIDLANIETHHNLSSALDEALSEVGLEVRSVGDEG